MNLAWTYSLWKQGDKLIEHNAKQATKWTSNGQRSIQRPKNTWKRSGERNGNNRLQMQLEKDRDSSPR